MRLNVSMLQWGMHRLRTGRTADIRSLACREWTLCPDEDVVVSPALHLDNALDKVKGLSPWRSWEIEKVLVKGGPVHHAASRAHLVENVSLVGSRLYARGAKLQPGFGSEQLILRRNAPRVFMPQANLMSTKAGSHFFGNFLLDIFPLALIAENDDRNVAAVTRTYEHEAGYRELLGLAHAPLMTNARIGQLTLYTDFAQNSFKAHRYRILRDRMRTRFANEQLRPPPGIYIKRGRTGELRELDNEIQIISLLRGLGFDIIEPSALNSATIARRSLDTHIVVSVEGSHLSHAIFTIADGGVFVVLQPPDRFAMAYKEFTDRLDMKFAFLVGDKSSTGFTIPPDDLHRLLDRLM